MISLLKSVFLFIPKPYHCINVTHALSNIYNTQEHSHVSPLTSENATYGLEL
jgi:hypothetical protein